MSSSTESARAALTKKIERAQKLPQPEGKVALQIAPVRLRAWVVDQKDVVCRPFYIACLELYPRGKVLNARIHSPASVPPDAAALLDFVLDHMLDPPSGEKRQRPTHVSFLESSVISVCAPLLKKLQIECDVLTIADGVTDYVKMFSDRLVKMDRASRGDSAENPGLLSVQGVTPSAALSLMTAAVTMYRAAPWDRFQESFAVEFTMPAASHLGARHLRYYASVLGSGGNVKGFAVMASLKALRTKYLRAMGIANIPSDECGEDPNRPAVASGAGVHSNKNNELLCARCGARVGEGYDRDGNRYVHRCGGCKCLLYCDENCQRSDWGLRHRGECQIAATNRQYIFHREEWSWLRRELALLFVDPTSVPFDDLDAAEVHKWPIVEDAEPPLHPMAYVTIGGTMHVRKVDRPTADEVRVLSLISTALTECAAPPPADCAVHLSNGVKLRVASDLSKLPKDSKS